MMFYPRCIVCSQEPYCLTIQKSDFILHNDCFQSLYQQFQLAPSKSISWKFQCTAFIMYNLIENNLLKSYFGSSPPPHFLFYFQNSRGNTDRIIQTLPKFWDIRKTDLHCGSLQDLIPYSQFFSAKRHF